MRSRAASVSQDDLRLQWPRHCSKKGILKEGMLIKSKEWDNCAGGRGLSGKNIAFLSSDHNGIPHSVRLRPQKRGEF